MKRSRLYTTLPIICTTLLIIIVTLFQPNQTAQAAGQVGTGTPESCTEAAFDAALAGGGTITFNCGTAPHTIILTGYKAISADTEIQGADLITLSGGNATTLFSNSATLTLRDITLTRGFGTSYGTIRNFGTLNLVNCQITYGNTTGHGGAIENYGEVNLTNSALAHNSADITGGALLNDWGEVTITDSQIYSNTAKNEGEGIKNNYGVMEIVGSHIMDNGTYGCNGTDGGGIWNNGTLTVTETTVKGNAALYGGGIFNLGTLSLDDTTIEGNTADCTSVGSGGGIHNNGTASVKDSRFINNIGGSYGGGITNYYTSTLTIDNTTFTQNYSWTGGAIQNTGALTITRSTIYTNTALNGGGIYVSWKNSTTSVTNVTISDNASENGGGGLDVYNGTVTLNYVTLVNNRGEAGIANNDGQLFLKNTTISGSSPINCIGTITSQGFNLSDKYACGLYHVGDLLNTDPKLDSLADNGGPTLTHLPQGDSPLIDGGQCVVGVNTDQRGISRPQDAACDIGAVEVKKVPLPPPPEMYKIFLPLITQD